MSCKFACRAREYCILWFITSLAWLITFIGSSLLATGFTGATIAGTIYTALNFVPFVRWYRSVQFTPKGDEDVKSNPANIVKFDSLVDMCLFAIINSFLFFSMG